MQLYQESDLVRVAKRENNKKRDYLLVNPLQGKHIPAEPGKVLALFRALADTVKAFCEGKHVLVIGFAETATAIGAQTAVSLGAFYLQTTREEVEGAQYLNFSEEHSHAVQQRLVKNHLDRVMARTELVIFAEDEVTTGNTILNLIDVMKKEYPGEREYAAASILNGMDKDALAVYERRNIRLFYLVKTDHAAYSQMLRQYTQKGEYISFMQQENGGRYSSREAERNKTERNTVCQSAGSQGLERKEMEETGRCRTARDSGEKKAEHGKGNQRAYTVQEFSAGGWVDARQLVSAADYEKACRYLVKQTKEFLHGGLSGSILVLGTEEFMYPALLMAEHLEKAGAQVWFHATTRSPIAVFKEEQYPLHVRYELPGCYDKDRRTFVYELASYDAVVIMTDSHSREQEGIQALVRAVGLKNHKIYVVRWCLS